MGLNSCFINKNKIIKKHIAVNVKSIAYVTSDKLKRLKIFIGLF